MAIDPPYRLDPFRNIVNVQWSRGRKRLYLYYFLFTQVIAGKGPSVAWSGPGVGTWTGPFKFVYYNYYSQEWDPPEPEPSDPYPEPPAIAVIQQRTYSEATFLNGPADWVEASGNWWVNSSLYWNYRVPGDITAFTPSYGYQYPDYIGYIGTPTDWHNALPEGYVDPVPEGFSPTDYPFT